MKIQTNKIVSATLIAALLFLNSCKKEETIIDKTSSDTVLDNGTLSNIAGSNLVTKLQKVLPALISRSKGSFKDNQLIGEMDCATVTIDSSSNPYIAHISFGPGGCTGSDGVHYSGHITATFNNEDFANSGDSIQFNFTNFYQDTLIINGVMTMINTGVNGNGNPTQSLSSNFQTNIISDGLYFNGANNFSMEFIERDSTITSDNQVRYTGAGSAITGTGVRVTQTISTPALMTECSDHFVSGTVLFQSPSYRDRIMDYGSGTCDSKATITSGGVTRTIILY